MPKNNQQTKPDRRAIASVDRSAWSEGRFVAEIIKGMSNVPGAMRNAIRESDNVLRDCIRGYRK